MWPAGDREVPDTAGSRCLGARAVLRVDGHSGQWKVMQKQTQGPASPGQSVACGEQAGSTGLETAVFSPLVSAQLSGAGPAAPGGRSRARGFWDCGGPGLLGAGDSGTVGTRALGAGDSGIVGTRALGAGDSGTVGELGPGKPPFAFQSLRRCCRHKGPLLECPFLSESK